MANSSTNSLFRMFTELVSVVGEDRVRAALGTAVEQAARTKAAVDSNVETLLGLANVPSRTELKRLERKVDALNATLANLTRKVDALAVDSRTPTRRRRPGVAGHARKP